MDFSNNVLKTLVECNERKSNKIKTKLVIDKKIENIKLFTDEKRLKQILLNFISNAFKFTQEGYIKLKAKYFPNMIEISVKDTGIGIKDQDHHLIFKENIQLDVDNEYNNNGSGLGLSIVKNIANVLNYKLGFISTYGKGSKFFIRINYNNSKNLLRMKSFSYKEIDFINSDIMNQDSLTLRSCTNENIQGKNVKNCLETSDIKCLSSRMTEEIDTKKNQNLNFLDFEHPKKFNHTNNHKHLEFTQFNFTLGMCKNINKNIVKLVVVDDHKLVREYTLNILNYLLKSFDDSLYEIVECSDGIELLNMVRLDTGNQIKLILTDENMEYLNGSESVKIIRKLHENRKIKDYHIVSITAFDDHETKERLMSSGVNSIITKPCTKSDLSKLLNNSFLPFLGN